MTRTIATALATTVIIVIVMHCLVTSNRLEKGIGETAWKADVIKIEDFAQLKEPPDVVAIGSSQLFMAARLKGKVPIYDLTLYGVSSAECAELFKKLRVVPKILIVEVSSNLLWENNHTAEMFIDHYRTRRPLIAISPAFLTEYQLIPVIQRQLLEHNKVPTKTTKRLARLKKKNFAKSFHFDISAKTKSQFSKRIIRFSRALQALKQRGTNVLLLPMPQDAEVEKGSAHQYVIQQFARAFPASEWNWISVPNRKWETFDGRHLIPEDAKILRKTLDEATKQYEGF